MRSLHFEDDVVALVPRLREIASMYRPHSQDAADDLVVFALEEAIGDVDSRRRGEEVLDWLHRLMRRHLD